MLLQTFAFTLGIFIFLGYIPKSGIAGSYGNALPCWGTAKLFSKTVLPVYIPSSHVSNPLLFSRERHQPTLSPFSVTYEPSWKCLFDLETGHFLMYFQAESDSLH